MRTVSDLMRAFVRVGFLFFIVIAFSLGADTAEAKQPYAGLVMDAKTGKVLYNHKGDQKRYPASLTKMMTLYLLFEAIERGELNKKSRIRFSNHAASMQPSKIYVKAGQSISVEQAIYALAIKSANDAAAAVAETLGGSESNFAKMMTQKARALGMKSTVFKNASGLPDSRQVTTARDMALLGIALREHFPQYYKYFSARSFKFGSKNYTNHNRLLGHIRGYDGVKTGYTRASGFNLVSSVETRGRSIVVVVLGGRTGKSRNAQVAKLIDQYLMKASRGRDRIVVARAGQGSNPFASLVKLVKRAKPVPERRPAEEPSTVTAYAAPVTASAEPSAASVPVPQAKVTNTDNITTASVPASDGPSLREQVSGWHVQIGAMPNRESALQRLEKARAALPGVLDGVVNYTETVNKNGGTLYRARFAGFSGKDAAWAACAQLKKAKFDCLALAN